MYNELLTIGPLTVYGYGLMIAIGVLAAYFNTEHLAKKSGLDPNPVFNILIIGVFFGFVGAKLLYYITIFDDIIQNPRLLLNIGDGFVVYGGIIAGILAAMIYCKKAKLVFSRYLDCAAPSIALAQGFGRIGCLLAGCCYGIAWEGPLSITFTNSSYAPNNIALFPSQLASSVFDFMNFFVLCLLFRKNKTPGKIGAFYLLFYSIGRFGIEFFRGDLIRGSVGSLSTSQFISLFVALAGIILLVWLPKRKVENEEDGEDTPV
jgi:phosphatidylglycerol:prolipoprotein diacylglycerol transferase